MSKGYGGYCQLIDSDGDFYLFAYSGYDLNVDFNSYKEASVDMDGIIMVGKEYFPEPTISRKRKRKPNGKKVWIEKRSYPEVDMIEMLMNGRIIVENSKRLFQNSSDEMDVIIIKLLLSMHRDYVRSGVIPEIKAVHS
ncbi:hypothetical protein [Granulicatella seriolae]|uniref:Uncharacterized protein n=1 Tax=Granulicatella seriolae TaxID=2967226 RepID=A0ABT1WLL3_9LACT|nr:hypothetical protein [Granulicatella seriolae]